MAFQKDNVDGLLGELNTTYLDEPDYEQLLRDAHLGIALVDAARPVSPDIDQRVVALLKKYG